MSPSIRNESNNFGNDICVCGKVNPSKSTEEEVEEEAGETTGMTITVTVVATPVAEGGEVVGAGLVEPEETVVGETETVEDMAKARVVVQNMAALQTLTKVI